MAEIWAVAAGNENSAPGQFVMGSATKTRYFPKDKVLPATSGIPLASDGST